MAYSGYLEPYVGEIRRLARKGKTPIEIARIVYDAGARSPTVLALTDYHYDDADHSYIREWHIRNMYLVVRQILGIGKKEPTKEQLEKRLAWAKKEFKDARDAIRKARKKS